MKKIYVVAIVFVFAVLFSFVVLSQQLPSLQKIKHNEQITANIALEKEDICVTEFYDETENIRGSCAYYHNFTLCLNSSGPNTDCSASQGEYFYPCVTGTRLVSKNQTTCRPDNKFLITINDGSAVLQKQIDHSDWGQCNYEEENGCLVVTCVSYNDGAHNGQFVECKSGMSCERFEICENSIKTLYRNSGDSFVEEDSSFFLPKLEVEEVEE